MILRNPPQCTVVSALFSISTFCDSTYIPVLCLLRFIPPPYKIRCMRKSGLRQQPPRPIWPIETPNYKRYFAFSFGSNLAGIPEKISPHHPTLSHCDKISDIESKGHYAASRHWRVCRVYADNDAGAQLYLLAWTWLLKRLVSQRADSWTVSSCVGLPDTVTNSMAVRPALEYFMADMGLLGSGQRGTWQDVIIEEG